MYKCSLYFGTEWYDSVQKWKAFGYFPQRSNRVVVRTFKPASSSLQGLVADGGWWMVLKLYNLAKRSM